MIALLYVRLVLTPNLVHRWIVDRQMSLTRCRLGKSLNDTFVLKQAGVIMTIPNMSQALT